MDTLGLLAAWTGVLSLLSSIVIVMAVYMATPLLQKWRSASNTNETSPIANRSADPDSSEPPASHLARLISLYGALILHVVAGAALAIISIQILDLGPALLAAVLPFSINPKILTRITGLVLLAGSYFFIFRLSYLVVKLRLITLPPPAGCADMALREMSHLRQIAGPIESATEQGARKASVR